MVILNKVLSSAFPDQYINDEGWKTKLLKHCDDNNRDEDKSLQVNNDDSSSQKIKAYLLK